jgi:outer membrane biosynthesis protein TonB
MHALGSTAGDVAYYALAIFLVAVGLATGYMFFRLGQAFERLSSFIRGTERDLLPVLVKSGGTVDRVNYQLDKLDTVTDSAVSMADSADTAVRAVTTAVTAPVEKASGLAAGIAHGFARFRRTRDFGEAKEAARAAKERRESDLRHDLRVAGRTPMSSERPEPTPAPDPWPRPEPTPKPDPIPKPDPAPAPPDEYPPAA